MISLEGRVRKTMEKVHYGYDPKFPLGGNKKPSPDPKERNQLMKKDWWLRNQPPP
jgi:hypothetical protein